VAHGRGHTKKVGQPGSAPKSTCGERPWVAMPSRRCPHPEWLLKRWTINPNH
jgi:hypothetical protein